MKNRNITIDELSAYRVLFICACVLSLIVGIFAVENAASMKKLDSSLSVGEFQDKAEVIKASNDTQCLYGSLNPKEYSHATHKQTALDCLQYSRNLNSYFLDSLSNSETPDFTLTYDFSDVKEVMEFCVTAPAQDSEVKEIQIGSMGNALVSCKEDDRKGKYIELEAAV